jgi:hypothetical protein
MKATFSSLSVPESVELDIHIHLTGKIAISPQVARRRVTRFVVSRIGNLLCAGEPEFVVGERFSWRVPVLLTRPDTGVLGRVGEISVDAETGELNIDPGTIEGIEQNARALAAGSSPTTD